MAYLTIKKVKGRYYGYIQESYREGGSVRTRTVEYLGAMEPAVAQQVQATRKQLEQADMAALVQSVRKASQTATRAPEITTQPQEAATPPETTPEPRYQRLEVNGRPQLVDMQTGELIEPQDTGVITTETAKPTLRPFADSLKLPPNLATHKLSLAAFHGTHRKFGNRLKAMQINPATMPDVVVKYGNTDGLKQDRNGAYIVTASRTPKRGHGLNKTKLWQHTRQAMSRATIDAIETEQPELFAHLKSQLDTSHREGKRLLFQHIAQTTSGAQRLGLSLQLLIWGKIPQPTSDKSRNKTTAQDLGQMSYNTAKGWRDEAAFILAEAHKNGWSALATKTQNASRKHKATITKKRNEIAQLSKLEILAGKRRAKLREIVQTETKLRATNELQNRVVNLRRVFDL
ncbi:MAG: hypothetical protein ABJO09_00090 [Hyphomicrobiales bacterium]|uniref:hypothetical protein n=1 Tax=Roseobacteraceae TaxID=2854170 RepID=UPI00328AC0A2